MDFQKISANSLESTEHERWLRNTGWAMLGKVSERMWLSAKKNSKKSQTIAAEKDRKLKAYYFLLQAFNGITQFFPAMSPALSSELSSSAKPSTKLQC